ncbi:MAG: hypothetical protein HY738_08045 [Bacteroidia bacterium]|nr:hypothetical protein [Bacteroidia bacterium]
MSKIEEKARDKIKDISKRENAKEIQTIELQTKIENFAKKYPEHEQFFILQALSKNPYYMDTDTEVKLLQKEMWTLCKKNKDNMALRHEKDKVTKIDNIKRWIKEKQLLVHPDFEQWIAHEPDTGILTMLYFLVSLKLYHRGQAYARQQILLNKKYWNTWEKGNIFSIEKIFD